jgi:hypothetical protein
MNVETIAFTIIDQGELSFKTQLPNCCGHKTKKALISQSFLLRAGRDSNLSRS